MRSQRENICLMVAVQVPQEQQAAGMVIGAPSVRRNLITSTAKAPGLAGGCSAMSRCSALVFASHGGEGRIGALSDYPIKF